MQENELDKPTDGFQWLPCVFGIDVIDLSLQFQDLLSLDGDVCGLTLGTEAHSVKASPLQAGQADLIATRMFDFRPEIKGSERPTLPWRHLKAGEP